MKIKNKDIYNAIELKRRKQGKVKKGVGRNSKVILKQRVLKY